MTSDPMDKQEEALDQWLDSSPGNQESDHLEDGNDELASLQDAIVSDGLRTNRKIDLVPVARNHRKYLISFALGVSLMMIGFIPAINEGPQMLIVILPFLVNLIWGIILTFRLAIAMERARATSHWLFAAFSPRLMGKASRLLQEHGYKVGLFGVNPQVVSETQKSK